MARCNFVPHDQDKEDQREEERLERKLARKECGEAPEAWLARFEGLDPEAPEYASVESLVEDLIDNDEKEFTHNQMACVNYRTGATTATIKRELEARGLTLKLRVRERTMRTFSTNPYDRFSSDSFYG